MGYGPPPPPPPKKGMSGGTIVLLILVGLFVLGGGSCVLCAAIGASAGGGRPSSAGGGRGSSPAQAASTQTAMQVEARTILTAYRGNEIAADNTYKGKLVQVNGGYVDDIKKDILDQPYVTVGTGAAFEIPQVQCSLRRDQAGKAATLQKGQRVTVRGEVKGLMFNVHLDDCEVL